MPTRHWCAWRTGTGASGTISLAMLTKMLPGAVYWLRVKALRRHSRLQRFADGDAGMGKRSRIDYYEVHFVIVGRLKINVQLLTLPC